MTTLGSMGHFWAKLMWGGGGGYGWDGGGGGALTPEHRPPLPAKHTH